MADDKQQISALLKRKEQLKRWHESESIKCLEKTAAKDKKVKFQDGCIFLAACSSGDCDEVKKLLDRGADINTSNVDGLTALHQACIDGNLDMVEFLVEYSADVDVRDNEGWTPLHATASCGFTEIARYLLKKQANVAAVNNDLDLPLDACEDADHNMKKVLQQAMDEQGVDADAARHEEEDKMMKDANHLLDLCNKYEVLPEYRHPKTGATALHVAAAKGYVKVMSVLIQAGSDINAKDFDGWTPLHAATHWGQEEACKILAENMCDMEARNVASQTVFDVADTELVKLLEELKHIQANLKDQEQDSPSMLPAHTGKRRSSVTRMSVEQKRHETLKNVDQEKAPLDAIPVMTEKDKIKSSSSSVVEDEEDSDIENNHGINKKAIQPNQPPENRDKPPMITTVEIREKQSKEMPRIEETVEITEKEYLKNLVDANEDIKSDVKISNEVIGDVLKRDKHFTEDKTEIQREQQDKTEKFEDRLGSKDILDNKLKGDTFISKEILQLELKEKIVGNIINNEKQDDKLKNDQDKKENNKKGIKVQQTGNEMMTYYNKNIINDIVKAKDRNNDEIQLIEDVLPKTGRDKMNRTASAQPRVTEIPKTCMTSKSCKNEIKREMDCVFWRNGLQKTGSTSAVPSHEIANKVNEDDKNLPRSASHPRLAEESKNENKKTENHEKARRPHLSSSSFTSGDYSSGMSERLSGTETQGLSNSYRYSPSLNSNSTLSTNQSSYVPYQRRQFENERKERERTDKEKDNMERENVANNRLSAPGSLMSTKVTTSYTASTNSPSTTVNTTTSSFAYAKKSFEPPKRDKETEMLRKVRAKIARETRRSTKGVTLEEVQQANEELRKSDNQIDPSSTTATATTTTVTTSSLLDRNRLSGITKSKDGTIDSIKKDTVTNSDKDSRLNSDINLRHTNSSLNSDSSFIQSWRRSRGDASKKEDDTSIRSRPQVDMDLSNSAPASRFYSTDLSLVPRNCADRSERNALPKSDVGNGVLGGSLNLTRSISLRAERKRTDEDPVNRFDQYKRKKEKEKADSETREKGEKDDKRHRLRQDWWSAGIANSTSENKDEEEEKDKENKGLLKDENKSDKIEKDDTNSQFCNKYDSSTDVSTHMFSQPNPCSDHSRYTSTVEKDYKELFEEQKRKNEKLKHELEQCKNVLHETKAELDQQTKKNEMNSVIETTNRREKRALERRVAELQDEVKKIDHLMEDNRRLREENGALIRVISKLSK